MNLMSRLLLPLLLAVCLPVLAADTWKPLTPAIAASFITFDQAGAVYVIDTAGQLLYLQKDSTAWKPLLKNKSVKYVSVSPNGDIAALDNSVPQAYLYRAGQWDTLDTDAQAILYTNGGSQTRLTKTGKVYFDNSLLPGTFQAITAMQKANGIYLLTTDQALLRYAKGDISPQTVKGSGGVKAMAGSGYGTKGGHYILDNSAEGKLQYYDPSYAYGWIRMDTPAPFKFISVDPQGRLYGIGTDNRVYMRPGN